MKTDEAKKINLAVLEGPPNANPGDIMPVSEGGQFIGYAIYDGNSWYYYVVTDHCLYCGRSDKDK